MNPSIPVFVTSFGRHAMLEKCLASLRRFDGFSPIVVVDNTTDNAHRQHAPWGRRLVPHDRPYVVCDEDIEIDPDCPPNLAWVLMVASDLFEKVGLQIRTDDVPDVERYAHSLQWERSLNARHIEGNMVFSAEVDTHFAIYSTPVNPGICGVRLAAPYQCRHLPWYNEEFTAEEIDYYRRTGADWARTHSAGELCIP